MFLLVAVAIALVGGCNYRIELPAGQVHPDAPAEAAHPFRVIALILVVGAVLTLLKGRE
jgi:hypothetical protein